MKNGTVFSPFLGPFKDRSDRRGTVLFRNASQAGNSHVALIDVSKYPADTEVPSFRSRGLRQVRRPGEHDLGAADEKDAVQQAIERFEVPAALQNRLTVSKQRQVTRRNK